MLVFGSFILQVYVFVNGRIHVYIVNVYLHAFVCITCFCFHECWYQNISQIYFSVFAIFNIFIAIPVLGCDIFVGDSFLFSYEVFFCFFFYEKKNRH